MTTQLLVDPGFYDSVTTIQVRELGDELPVSGDVTDQIRKIILAAHVAGANEIVVDTTGPGYVLFEELIRQLALVGSKISVVPDGR